MIYQCNHCKAKFDELEFEDFCFEDEYGVSSEFDNYNYGSRGVCPECGSEDVDEIWEFEEDE